MDDKQMTQKPSPAPEWLRELEKAKEQYSAYPGLYDLVRLCELLSPPEPPPPYYPPTTGFLMRRIPLTDNKSRLLPNPPATHETQKTDG